MWRYRERLDIPPGTAPVTLGEGDTPLVRAAARDGFGGLDVRWKLEHVNPSGSHKDRALAVAVAVAAAQGARTVFVASAGSTGLAAAAYAARAGLRCVVLVGGDASDRRLLPLRLTGARVLRVGASVDDALDVLADLARAHGLVDVSTRRSGNAWQAEGPKTIAYELVDTLGHAPDAVVIPIGGGGTLASIGRGFDELRAAGTIERLPRLIGTQPAGYATLVAALRDGLATDAELRAAAFTERPDTVQVKTAHTYAPDGAEALAAVRASGGTVLAIDDAAALAGVRSLAEREGLYVEPSSGVVVPAIERLVGDGLVRDGELVVGLVCGSGFRELDALEASRPELTPIEAVAPGDLAATLLALA